MSSFSRTTQGGADFEQLCTGAVRNYSANPADIAELTRVKNIKQRLIDQLEDTVRELEHNSDRTIAKIYIGKTFIQRKKARGQGYQRFNPLNHKTWRKNGICNRWCKHKKEDYGRDGLVVLGAITRQTVPGRLRGRVQQEEFALAMEQMLLHHFLLFKPDPRVVNETFTAGHLAEHNYYAYAVYMAFRYDRESPPFPEEPNNSSSPSNETGHTPSLPSPPRLKLSLRRRSVSEPGPSRTPLEETLTVT